MSLFQVKLEVLYFMATYGLLIGILMFGRYLAKKKMKLATRFNEIKELTVLVPFRNEEANLKKLIECIQNQTVFPKEIIFIDDNSEDSSLESLRNLTFPHRILSLSVSEEGKKTAISKGVQNSSTRFVLTWDADIEMDSNYFETLEKYKWTDLVILPVEMRGSKLVPGFFAMDYQLQTQTNVALSGYFRPITASGANLLFLKTAFEEAEKTRSDFQISSGDDLFLMKEFRNTKKAISIVIDAELKVITNAPSTIIPGLHQRRRWLSKSTKVGDSFATIFGLFVFAIQMIYYTFAWYQLYLGNWGGTLLMVLIKGELDAFLSTYKFQDQFNTLQVFFYQLIYPIYMVYLVLFGFNGKVKWKGRMGLKNKL
jgi:poly-beta-1,6-N-acetyl-D-glucosamine synthase